MALEHTMLSTLVAGLLEVMRGKGKREYICGGGDSLFFLKIKVEGKTTVCLFLGTCRMHGSCVSVLGFSSIFTPHVGCTVIGMF